MTDPVAQQLDRIEMEFTTLRTTLTSDGHRSVGYWMQSLGFEFAVVALCLNGLANRSVPHLGLVAFAVVGLVLLGVFFFGQRHLTTYLSQVNGTFLAFVELRKLAYEQMKALDVRVKVPEYVGPMLFADRQLRIFTFVKTGVLVASVVAMLLAVWDLPPSSR